MANITDIQVTPTSGLLHIDALLDTGPDWNFVTVPGNTITYTFSVASDNEPGERGQVSFSSAQQTGTRAAFDYITSLTGIVFTETSNPASAQLHLCSMDLAGPSTAGLCSWYVDYTNTPSTGALVSYGVNAYVYLDNAEFGTRNSKLARGTEAYDTLLHELGHLLGLKHPFTDTIQLPMGQDNTNNTLMSYVDAGGPYGAFQPYDIAALNWLYGGDGLRGALGIHSSGGGRFITGTGSADTLTGTNANDTLRGDGGNDMLNGGAGEDTAVFGGTKNEYQFSEQADGTLIISGADGIDVLDGVELLRFSDGAVRRADVDIIAPAAPSVSASKNGAGYVVGNEPFFVGIAEANSTVKLYSGSTLLASVSTNAVGFWQASSSVLADGAYTVYATATDAAGNVSAPSASLAFKVDARDPVAPTGAVVANGAGQLASNQALFSGTAEAGSVVSLINDVNGANTVLAKVTVGASGFWSTTSNPLPDGTYSVTVQSADAADNTSDAASKLNFSVASTLNRLGTAGNDILTGGAGNNALSGLGGIDYAAYAGARANYTVSQSTNGYTVTALSGGDGLDSLIGVERISFADKTLGIDIDGTGGIAYRLYRAAFDRVPDLAGLGYWIKQMDGGMTLDTVAANFLLVAEFGAMYGANPTNQTFVTKLYEHVLNRLPDQGGFDFWLDALESGVTRAGVLRSFSESVENRAQVIGEIQNGFEYIPYLA